MGTFLPSRVPSGDMVTLTVCGFPLNQYQILNDSVGDPESTGDPHVFGPPGPGSISQRYGPGSGSFPFLIEVLSRL
jgi:hypothetical protein